MDVTLADVAKHAGVSVGAVRKVIRGDDSVRPYIKTLVTKAVKTLDYKPNLVARALSDKRLNLIPIYVHVLNEYYFGNLASHLSRHLVQRGMEPALCFNAEHLLHMSRSFSTAGSVLVGGLCADNVYDLSERQKIVTIHAHIPTVPGVGNVRIDFVGAYRALTQMMLVRGRRNIALVSAQYLECVKNGWIANKFPFVFDMLGDAGLATAGPSARHVFASEKELGAWLDAHPGSVDAVFCENDMEAGKVALALAVRGIKMPTDILVAGCDDNHRPLGAWSVRLDTAAIAEKTVELLCRLLNGENVTQNPVYMPEIIDENGNTVPLDR